MNVKIHSILDWNYDPESYFKNISFSRYYIIEEEHTLRVKSAVLWGGRLSEALAAYFLFGLLFDPEDGGSTFQLNICNIIPENSASHPRR
jgi:hypothetical protein